MRKRIPAIAKDNDKREHKSLSPKKINLDYSKKRTIKKINITEDKTDLKKKIIKKDPAKLKLPKTLTIKSNLVRLNKFIANAGICSRREADKLIESGAVSVNGNIVTTLGTKVSPQDSIQFGGETLKSEKLRYILLNKPKDYITTVDDPQERKTVMLLINGACKERVYPVGRLDRNTTGLLLFTNDGELAKKLTHPKHNIKKVYHVELEQKLKSEDLDKILAGIELEDGFIKIDDIGYAGNEEDKRIIGVELHSGRNRIVRRIFESLGYKVVKLDRVVFGSLTKANLPRGKWRHLTEEEINILRRIH